MAASHKSHPGAEGASAPDLGRVQRADLLDDGVVLELFRGERSWLVLTTDRHAPVRTAAERPRRG